MVTLSAHYNFKSVVEEFLELKPFTGPHAELLRKQVRERAYEVLAGPDIRYMPAFKILDLLAEMVNTASAVAIEPQLRAHEATALVRASLADNSPLIKEFLLEAALERARYEPMMVDAPGADALTHRNLTLRKRWLAMRHAHDALATLPTDWMEQVSLAVGRAIAADCFRQYRQGPLMQYFAEMLSAARDIHAAKGTLEQVQEALGEDGALWKRYALKAARYLDKTAAGDEERVPQQSRIPSAHLPPPQSLQ